MAYIKETISVYGSKLDFANALKNFFINNQIAPFELVSEDFTGEYPQITVRRNNLNLYFVISSSSALSSLKVSHRVRDGEYKANGDYTFSHTQSESANAINRAVKILLIKNDESIVLQIASWNAVSISNGITIIDTKLLDNKNLIGSGSYNSSGTNIQLLETTSQLLYTPRPFHVGSNTENTLILSNTLAVNDPSEVYCGNVNGLISAGGAKQFRCYVTALNSYYGIWNDICIAIGDKVEYSSDEKTE